MRLLITENDPLVRHWLSSQAGDLGIELSFAGNMLEVLDAVDNAPPDCLILDASSSSGEGLPLWSQVREDPETRHLPILLYSSSDRWQSVAELAGTLVDGFIPRPFTTNAIVDAVQEVANLGQAAHRCSCSN